jgi:hypothetical protein
MCEFRVGIVYHVVMDRKALDTLIDQLPAELREEVFDYASYLLERKATRPQGARQANLHRGAVHMSDDFDVPLSEQFWLGE